MCIITSLFVVASTLMGLAVPSSGVELSPEPETWLQKADVALDGSVHYLDRRGNPAESMFFASKAEELARAMGRPELVHKALLAQAWAAAAGGNYEYALQVLDKVFALEVLDPKWKERAQQLRQVWELGLGNSGLAFDYSLDLQMYRPEWLPAIELAELDQDLYEKLRLFSAIHLLSLASPSLQQMPDLARQVDLKRLLVSTRESMENRLCPGDQAGWLCDLQPLLEARALIAAHESGSAVDLLRKTIEDFSSPNGADDFYTRGLIRLALADALAAPRSSPLDLDLRLFVSGKTPSESSFSLTAGDLSISWESSQLSEIRDLLNSAEADFEVSECQRCSIDVQFRRAFLDWRRNSDRSVSSAFDAVAQRFREIGDDFLFRRAEAIAIATDPNLESSVKRIPEETPWGSAIGAARLNRRLAELRWRHHDWKGAETAFKLAMAWGRAAVAPASADSETKSIARGAPGFILQTARRKSLLETAMGRFEEAALSLELQVLGGLETLRSNTSEVALSKNPQWPNNDKVQPLVMLETLVTLYGDALGRDDLHRARLYVERMLEIGNRAEAAMIGQLVAQWSRQAKWHIWLARGKFQKILDQASSVDAPFIVMAHLGLRQREKAIEVAKAFAEKSLQGLRRSFEGTTLEEASPSQALALQSLRQDLEQAILLLAIMRDGEVALNFWAQADQIWRASGMSSHDSPFFSVAETEPWLKPATRALASEVNLAEHTNGNKVESIKLWENTSALYSEALAAIRKASSNSENAFDQSSFLDRSSDIFGDVVRFYADGFPEIGIKANPTKALNLIEEYRSTFFQSLVNAQGAVLEGEARWWRRRVESEARRIDEVRQESESSTEKSQDAWRSPIGLADELGDRPDWSLSAVKPDVTPVEDLLRQRFQSDQPTTILIYHKDRWRVRVFVVKPEAGIEARILTPEEPWSGSHIKLKKLAFQLHSKLEFQVEDWQTPARELYERLVEPIEGLLPSPKQEMRPRLILIPYQSLHLIPFGILPNREGRLLLEDYDVTYAPSLQFIFQNNKKRPLGRVLEEPVAVGFDKSLLAAEQEAKTVARILGLDSPSVLTGSEATPSAILKVLKQATLVHLASHTVIRDQNPFQTQIELYGRDLWLYELLARDYSNLELAVLSACVTGVNEYSRSDEVIGLARNFLAAGTRSVVASLWRIGDGDLESLWSYFYASLKAGKQPYEALISAQLAHIDLHPGIWGSFIYVGGVP